MKTAPAPFTKTPEDFSDTISEEVKYVTEDGDVFSDKTQAQDHAFCVARTDYANELLAYGHSIGDIYRAVGLNGLDPILDKVTTNSRLSIRRGQCTDSPGHRPIKFYLQLTYMDVYGTPRWVAWPYGNKVNIGDIIRYAKNECSEL